MGLLLYLWVIVYWHNKNLINSLFYIVGIKGRYCISEVYSNVGDGYSHACECGCNHMKMQ